MSSGPSPPVVRAAGGVVWRRRRKGSGERGVEVLLVHRPEPHADWSFPKGKLDPGERNRDAALREVLEETGLRCALGPKLLEVRYETPRGEDKRVRFWAMTELEDTGFRPNAEIDKIRWVPMDEAGRSLSWPTDVRVLEAFGRLPGLSDQPID